MVVCLGMILSLSTDCVGFVGVVWCFVLRCVVLRCDVLCCAVLPCRVASFLLLYDVVWGCLVFSLSCHVLLYLFCQYPALVLVFVLCCVVLCCLALACLIVHRSLVLFYL